MVKKEKKKLYKHVRIQPAVNYYIVLQTFSRYLLRQIFAMTVDVTDILQTSKHNFQSQAKHKNMSNLILRGKIFFQR